MMKKWIYAFLVCLMTWTLVSCGSQDQTTLSSQSKESLAPSEDSRILVAYFSATNHTKDVAEIIATTLDADLYQIEPEILYSQEDLNYNDSTSRVSIERSDPNSRPAISNSIDDIDQYDVIFVGYPIWWGEAPNILSTFMESYNFSHKTLIPFCTSASSGFGSSDATLQEIASNANWLEGKRFPSNASSEEIQAWLQEFEFK